MLHKYSLMAMVNVLNSYDANKGSSFHNTLIFPAKCFRRAERVSSLDPVVANRTLYNSPVATFSSNLLPIISEN